MTTDKPRETATRLKVLGFFTRIPTATETERLVSDFFGGAPCGGAPCGGAHLDEGAPADRPAGSMGGDAGPVGNGVVDLEILGPGDETKVKEKWSWNSPRAILVGSGGTEQRVVKFLTEMNEPAIILSIPRDNSLPAAMEVAAWLRGSGRPFMLVQGSDIETQCGEIVNAAGVMSTLGKSRAGLVGKPSEWLLASSQDPFSVENRWGIRVVQLPGSLLENLSTLPDPAKGISAEFSRVFKKVLERNDSEGFDSSAQASIQVYSILKAAIDSHSLDAVGVNCFPLTRQGTTACLALAALNSMGIPAACEADVSMLVSMMVGLQISGKPGFMANMTEVDASSGRIRLSHCTIDPTMTDGYSLDSHYESGVGLAVRGKLPIGAPVTVFRLGGFHLEEFFAHEGTITDNPQDRENCRTSVRIDIGSAASSELLERPLGNHHLVLPGKHVAGLRFLMNLRKLVLNDIYM